MQCVQSKIWIRVLGTGVVLSLILTTFLVYGNGYTNDITKYVFKHSHLSEPKCLQSTSPHSDGGNGTWEFIVERDGDNHGLSGEQCLAAFPKLFVQLDKSAKFRQNNAIGLKELDHLSGGNGLVRGIIDHGELYIVDFGEMPYTFTRGKASLHSLNRALASFPDRHSLPNIEFVLTTHDYSDTQGPIWSYSKKDEDEEVWLMPDFGYWSWPEVNIGHYGGIRRRIAAVDDGEVTLDGKVIPGQSFQDKKKQLAWRGSVATNPELRGKFIKATQGKSWASVREINWGNKEDAQQNLLPMEEYCRYMFLAHTEGRSFSGRAKYLLNCRSVVVSHKLVWLEAHHAALVASGPDANYVEVERDFSDLDRKIEFLIDNPESAERIANNAVRTFRDRYLTPAAESCYWRHLIRTYASSCGFETDLYQIKDGKAQPRGVDFESWVLMSS